LSTVSENIKMLFSKMDDYVSTKTVVGEAVTVGEVILVPLVDVSFGMGTVLNESDSSEKNKSTDLGGGGVGAKMTPSAVIVIMNGTVQLVNIKNQDTTSKLIDMIPGVLSKFNLGSLFEKKEEDSPDVDINVEVD